VKVVSRDLIGYDMISARMQEACDEEKKKLANKYFSFLIIVSRLGFDF
jgi:hypothetical protein